MTAHGNASCTFGIIDNQLAVYPRIYGLIVNNETTAICSGNATAWNLCYYHTASPNIIYLGVYRPPSSSEGSFSLVPGSFMSYSAPLQTISVFPCIQISIPVSEQFAVQAGDVIAACVRPPSGHGRVGIVDCTTTMFPRQ